jgi:membrane associated rhomboid family serine protease
MQAPPEDNNPINRAYEAWAARTPVVCRCLCVGLAACYGFSWILDLQRGLETVPFRIVRRFELWRLILSPCVGNSLLGTVVALFVLGDGVGPRLEQSWGSMRMMIATLTASIVINLSFCALCYLFTMMIGSAEPALASMSGGWPLLLCLITIECLSSPDGTRPLPCIPIQVPRDRYPAALLLLLLILGAPKLSLSLGCAYGYAYAKGYLEVLKPKPALVSRCEAASALACVTSDPTFVSAERSLGASAFTVSGGDWADPENPSSVNRGFSTMLAEARQAAFPPEPPGGQGRVLGAAAPAAAPLVPTPAPTPPSPQRTARGNREAILAAAERRSRQQNAGS